MRKILCVVLVMCSMMLLAGCGKKEVMTAEEFAAHMEKEGFIVDSGNGEDFPLQGVLDSQKENIQKVVVVGKAPYTKGEFYVWKDEESAKEWYDSEYNMMKKMQDKTKSQITEKRSTDDYSKIIVKVKEGYSIRVRISNTTFRISAYNEDWDDVKKALSRTGY